MGARFQLRRLASKRVAKLHSHKAGLASCGKAGLE
jgi:hypothetical protein